MKQSIHAAAYSSACVAVKPSPDGPELTDHTRSAPAKLPAMSRDPPAPSSLQHATQTTGTSPNVAVSMHAPDSASHSLTDLSADAVAARSCGAEPAPGEG